MGSDPRPVERTRLRRQSNPSQSAALASTNSGADATSTSAPPTSLDSSNSQTMATTSNISQASATSPAPTSPATSPTSSASPSQVSGSSQADSSAPSSTFVTSSTISPSSLSVSPSSSPSSSATPSTVSSSSLPLTTATSSSSSSTFTSDTPSTSTTSTSTSSASTPTSTSTTSDFTTSTSSTSTSSVTTTSSSSTTSAFTATSTSSSSASTTSDFTALLTTITSSTVTTIDGHPTTITTVYPTSLNSSPSTSTSSSSTQRAGIIAGSAIGASLLAILAIGVLCYSQRRLKRKKQSLAHRGLAAPRSVLLADEDAFDLASGPSRLSFAPQLLRPRGLETGSIFHEGVWPPPGAQSRLGDPLLAGSTVDLATIVDDVMGAGDQHGRTVSVGSDVPLLANMSPERGGEASSPANPVASSSRPETTSRSRLTYSSDVSETTPLDPSGHERQLSDDVSPGFFPSRIHSRPVALPVMRGKSDRSVASISTTGTVRGGPPGFGSLVVVNTSPPEAERPLVDLTPIAEHPPREIPPLYHTIHKDASDTWKASSSTDNQLPNREAQRTPSAEGGAPSDSREQGPSSSTSQPAS